MYRDIVFACGVLLAAVTAEDQSVVNLAGLVNCSSPRSVQTSLQKCMDLYSVPVTLFNNSSIDPVSVLTQFDGNTTAKLCKKENREDYIKAILCMRFITRKCSGNSVLQAMISSKEQVRQQVQFLCQVIGEYNDDCVKDKLQDIMDCVNVSTIVTGVMEDNATSMENIISQSVCAGLYLNRQCARKHLKTCGDTTLQIYEQGFPSMDVCKNFTDLDTGTGGDMIVECSSDWAIRKSYLTCQVNSGIFQPLPNMDTSDETAEYTMNAVTLKNVKEMCKKEEQAADLLNCTLSVQRECSSDKLKPTVPDTQTLLEGFRQLCKGVEGFDAVCVSSAVDSACQERKRRSVYQSSILKHLCDDTLAHKKCLVDAVKSCGDMTSSKYDEMLSAQLPQMCLGRETTDPVNAASEHPASTLALLMTAIMLLY